MKGYQKLKVDNIQYQNIKDIQLENGSYIQEHYVGTAKKLYSKNTLIATLSVDNSLSLGGISNQQFTSFLGMFNKNLYNQFIVKPELYNLNIEFKGSARGKNIQEWDKLPIDSYFYNIDLKSAYWQIAYKLGYITKTIFEKYISNDSFKQAKRLCISFLARPNNMYYMNDNGNYVLECDTLVLKGVYDNIRHELYNSINKALKMSKNWLEYNIDGVYISKDELNIVRQEFKKIGLLYKITECKKISDTDFQYGFKLRKFKNK